MEDVTFEICLEDDGSDRKESACNARDPGLMPGSGRSPGEGDDHPLQYSGLENSMDRGAWQTSVSGGQKESDKTERLTALTVEDE